MPRSSLHDIFSPVFREIDKLVAEQVNLVYLKRVREKHPKDKIKVSQYSLTIIILDKANSPVGYLPRRRIWFERLSP